MVKNKKKSEVRKRSEGILLIVNLVIALFAFAFMISLETKVVSGANGANFVSGTDTGPVGSMTPEQFKEGINTFFPKTPEPVSTGIFEEGATGMDKFKAVMGGKYANPTISGGLMTGLLWAFTAYTAASLIGSLLGLEPTTTKALQYSMAAGAGTAGLLKGLALKGIGSHYILAGLGVGAIVFILTYKKVEYKTVTFNCLPWEAPIGGNDCEKCNDEIHKCSEYRCKSLGQACEIVNVGTAEERCVWKNPQDVSSPMIRPWKEIITSGYKYSDISPRPPGGGTKIVKQSADPDIEPYTPIEFGIQTNKPAQCKVSFNLTAGYDEMEYYFGESSFYAYNHSQKMSLPSPKDINNLADANSNTTGGLTIQNDGNYLFYVRCRNVNGFYNKDPYVIKFRVGKGPDATPPEIKETSIANNAPVQYEVDKVEITVYTNEPANCRWSKDNDQAFKMMTNEMSCANNLWEMSSNMLYACTGTLTNVEDRKDNKYYFKCEDQPWMSQDKRNAMTTGYPLTLKGTQPLNIDLDSVKPKSGENVTGATTTIPVFIELETQNGYKDGEAYCYYSLDKNNFIEFQNTSSYKHFQRQDLSEGIYTYYLKCIDLGGNQASVNTTFSVYVDTQAPNVVRVLYNADSLDIMTNEDAECYYTNNENTKCNFEIGENSLGTLMRHLTSTNKKEHAAEWNINQNYYIKCMDLNGKQPNPTECSIIARPVEMSGASESV